MEVFAVEEDVRRIGNAMAALDQDRFGAHGSNGFGCLFHIMQTFNGFPCQHFRFRQVRRQDIGQGKEDFLQCLFGFRHQQAMAAGSHHDRIDDDVRRLVLLQLIGDDADRFRYANHTDFDGIDVDIFKDRIDLRSDEFRRDVHIPAHALGILGYDSRNDIQGKTTVSAKSLTIRCGAGSARRIRPGNG